jgi:hypothetical protein
VSQEGTRRHPAQVDRARDKDAKPSPMVSERLTYRVVAPNDLGAFVSLVQDEHTRQYMMDGVLHSPAWCAERIHESEVLFGRRGLGLWLAYEQGSGELVGFCGFLEVLAVDPDHPEPELAYALFERFTGRETRPHYACSRSSGSRALRPIRGHSATCSCCDWAERERRHMRYSSTKKSVHCGTFRTSTLGG